MPTVRKIELMPPELKSWLKASLVERGFSGYEGIAEELNFRLEEAGLELRIQKSALNEFGKEHKEFVKHQELASEWAKEWMTDMGLKDQIERHNVLFQMLTTLAFKAMKSEINKEGAEIDPKALHFIGRMLKDIMQSSGMVQTMLDKDRQKQAKKLDKAVASGDLKGMSADTVRAIKEKVLGVKA